MSDDAENQKLPVFSGMLKISPNNNWKMYVEEGKAMTEADCLKWLQNCGEHRRHTRTPEKGQTNSILQTLAHPHYEMAEGERVQQQKNPTINRLYSKVFHL